MIICNLKQILADRNLAITKVANETGISRPTLTTLVNNKNRGIQYDTLNKLCRYLDIPVGNLFKEIDDSIMEDIELFIKKMKSYGLSLGEIKTMIKGLEES